MALSQSQTEKDWKAKGQEIRASILSASIYFLFECMFVGKGVIGQSH